MWRDKNILALSNTLNCVIRTMIDGEATFLRFRHRICLRVKLEHENKANCSKFIMPTSGKLSHGDKNNNSEKYTPAPKKKKKKD